MQSYLLTKRLGPRPQTSSSNLHAQLDQNAPTDLQESLYAMVVGLPGVVVGPSAVSVPGARAFHLPSCTPSRNDCFMVQHEFAHLHPAHDGSLHMTLPPAIVEKVIANGWAELHPVAGQYGLPANMVMVYGPRDEKELNIVAELVRASHEHANQHATTTKS